MCFKIVFNRELPKYNFFLMYSLNDELPIALCAHVFYFVSLNYLLRLPFPYEIIWGFIWSSLKKGILFEGCFPHDLVGLIPVSISII